MTRAIALTDAEMDRMAHELAGHVIETRCITAGEDALYKAIAERMEKRPRRRRVNFPEYYRFLEKFEVRFAKGIRSVWADEKAQMIANMKRTPKGLAGARTKDGFDPTFEQWLYPQGPARTALAAGYYAVAKKLLEEAALREAGFMGISISWDVMNPNIAKWLKGYAPKFSAKLEQINYDELKRTLLEGWEAGESIHDLTNRVYELYDDWGFRRAELIARTESITGSNRGSIETWRASGVADRKMWVYTPLGDEDCEICGPLDGEVRELDETFFPPDGYSDGQGPTAHPNCRCVLVGILEGETIDEEGNID